MKTILIPTDFSKYANHALEAGVKFAERFGASLHLIHWLDYPANWEDTPTEEQAKHPIKLKAVENANSNFEKIKNTYSDLSIITSFAYGKFHHTIAQYVKNHRVDLLIMGSHGVSGKNEYFIGSNTQRVVRTVRCPVLILKSPLESIDFKKVVFSSNFNEDEKAPFWYFRNFIKPFMPEIHLLAVKQMGIFLSTPSVVYQKAMEEFKSLCSPFHCETHLNTDFSIDQGVRTFARKMGADLIAISNHKRSPLKRFIAGSNVEFLVNHSDLPVLSIDFV